ncbi:MAG: AtpZ/AtpI family protein [Candidatus Limnocylindria bacterium]
MWGLALELGFRMGISVVMGLVPGILLDNLLGTSPLFTLAGIVLGMGAAFYTIWEVARRAMRR